VEEKAVLNCNFKRKGMTFSSDFGKIKVNRKLILIQFHGKKKSIPRFDFMLMVMKSPGFLINLHCQKTSRERAFGNIRN
jgi:hypothetical protein